MRILAPILSLALTGTAVAQDATDDWDNTVNAEAKLTMASVDFGGIGIAVRCQDGGLDAVITGLPPVTDAERRTITLKFADDESPRATMWNVAVNPATGVSERPAAFARQLRQGGRLDVVVPGGAEGGRNLRYALDLPSAHAVIDQTLQACGKPLEDARDAELAALGDAGLPGGVNWASPPQPTYPTRRVYERGFAVVTCLSEPDGGLRACEIETEHPRDGGFGEATLDATRRARLENTAAPGQPITPRMVSFRSNFHMESNGEAARRSPHGTRLPGSRN